MEAEVVCLDSFPSHLGPLEVFMSRAHQVSVFPRDTDPHTVLLTPLHPHGTTDTGILLRVHPTEEETAGCPEDSRCPLRGSDPPVRSSDLPVRGSGPPVRLLASRLLLQRVGSRGSVRAVVPVPVQKVVLGARSLRRTGAQQVLSGLLELCSPGQELLVRQGEKLVLPGAPGQELLVLEVSPVTQGMITAHTSVVLTELLEPVSSSALPPHCKLLSLCVSDFALCADSLVREGSLLDKPRLLGSRFCGALQGLECRVEVKVVDPQQWLLESCAVDCDSSVFVSKRLLLRLGLFNQEWVRLLWASGACRASTGDGPVVRERLVSIQVVDLPTSLQTHQDVGFISATLWFNMTDGEVIPGNGCTLRMKRWSPSCEQPAGRSSESVCRRASPQHATELHIQPVFSPLVHNPSCWDPLLAQHFSTPRLVAEGDIVTVPVRNHPDLLENNCEGILRCPVMFFRVQKVCPSAEEEGGGRGGGFHLADRIHSSLYMGPPVNSRVPCCSSEGESLRNTMIPAGLSRTVEILSSTILPYLQHSSLSGCTVLLHAPPRSGKMTAVRAVSSRLNLHLVKVDCVSLCADTPAASEVKLSSAFQRADSLQPCILLLRNLQLLLSPRGAAEEGRVTGTLCRLLHSASCSVVVVTTVCRPQDLPASVMAAFVHQVEMEAPTEEDRGSVLASLSQELQLGMDVNLRKLSKLTAGLVLGDLRALMVEAGRAACRRLTHSCGVQQQEDLCSSGVTILNQDFLLALETLQHTQAKAIGGPKIPNVRWEDVGGQHHVKKEILDTVELPLQHPELMSLGLIRTGVLLYGPPGTGKTLLAKAVATECSMTFLSVKGPELINMYVGQSEENIREVFLRARSAAPCVVFFDELDSLAPNRGRSGDSGGVMDRVVSQLLAELDSLHSFPGVFVIGATNRPDLLDQSLLRPGRFDKLVYVGINDSRVSQLQVLQAILRKFQLDSDVNLQDLVDSCPAQMTGADLYALCSDAMTAAIKRKIALINRGVDSEDSSIRLSLQDFCSALESFRPSVSDQELLRYKRLQQKLSAQ